MSRKNLNRNKQNKRKVVSNDKQKKTKTKSEVTNSRKKKVVASRNSVKNIPDTIKEKRNRNEPGMGLERAGSGFANVVCGNTITYCGVDYRFSTSADSPPLEYRAESAIPSNSRENLKVNPTFELGDEVGIIFGAKVTRDSALDALDTMMYAIRHGAVDASENCPSESGEDEDCIDDDD